MDSGELTAWHFATRQSVRVRWDRGIISQVEAGGTPPEGLWIAPALFDVQVNGYAGVDFQQDNLTEDDLLRTVRGLRADGCAQFLLTLVTDEWTRLTARLRHFVNLRNASDELKAAIVGWHIEGPFLSPEPGFHGAHDPKLMIDPKPEHIQELREIAGDARMLLTLAPEREGAIQAIKLAVSVGMKVSLGHTNASAEVLDRARQADATMFTHLLNGCPRELDRHDNILWRVFETVGLTPSLIPDRIHLSAAPFRLIHRTLNNAVFYTSDAMAAAGAPPGRYTIGKLEVEVGPDHIVRQPGRTNFAGSALRPIDGVFRAAEMLNCPWQDVWARYSVVPAQLLGLTRELVVGAPATFCTLIVETDNKWRDLRTCWNG